MKILVIGLGSMGKRRIRNLIALDRTKSIAGFDPRKERRTETEKYGVTTFDNFEDALIQHNPDIFIISTPPNLHMQYAYIAEEKNIHCFIEASVVESSKILQLAAKVKNKRILMAPSCTMKYFPMPLKVKELIQANKIGKALNFNYITGQYLPNWHPWEKIQDFYVSNPDTGGCREIVPFELTWLNDIFGKPKPLFCVRKKLTEINTEIDDIYQMTLEYPGNVIGNIIIEIISRPKATRELRIIGTEGIISYNGDINELKYIYNGMDNWERIKFKTGTLEIGYINPEEPYINEMRDFILGVDRTSRGLPSGFPNTLESDYQTLQLLYALEDISGSEKNLSK